jgi:AraC family transcriptional regulator
MNLWLITRLNAGYCFSRYDGPVPDGMEKMVIPATTWAVFPNVFKAWKRLYTEWLPSSGYELVDLPCIEGFYVPGYNPENELWVPVKARK